MKDKRAKPCPLCGGQDAVHIGWSWVGPNGKVVLNKLGKQRRRAEHRYITCWPCGITIKRHTLREALQAWNRRAA